MENLLFGGSTINIIIGFAILAFALIAIFTDSTPVKWVASLLAIAGLGVLYKRMFPSDSEIKRKYEENEAASNQYYEDRKKTLTTISDNKKKVETLKEEKVRIDQQDGDIQEKVRIVDTEIEQLEKQNQALEKSVDERQKKLDAFFSRKDKPQSALTTPSSSTSISGYTLKGDVE